MKNVKVRGRANGVALLTGEVKAKAKLGHLLIGDAMHPKALHPDHPMAIAVG